MPRALPVTAQRREIDYYLGLPYSMTLYPSPEGGFVAEIRDLPGCLTQAETATEALELVEDAKRSWLELALARGITIPEPQVAGYSGRFVVRIPKSLHRHLAEAASAEGVSLNQLVVALLAASQGLITAGEGDRRKAAAHRRRPAPRPSRSRPPGRG